MKSVAIPLALYVHLPWCQSKCPYCDFNSHAAGGAMPRRRYLDALHADLAVEATAAAGRTLSSIYLGGGTPSLFTPAEIASVLVNCRDLFSLADDCEITMEANPGTVERGSMAGYRDAGVTRLSLGAQSFDAVALERLGRIHGPDEIRTAYREAAAAGFDSINVDLMFGLPGQDIDRAMADVDALLELDAPHLSCYQLTLEPNTVFHRRPPPDLPDEDTVARIEARCHARLRAAGYEHYEVSAFARPGHRCRHNLNYWTFGDYLAAGAGAHGKLTRADGSVHRYRKPAHPMSFIDSAGRGATTTAVAVRELGFEYMLNVLRLADGFEMAEFTGRTGLEADAVMATLEKARDDGLLRESGAGHWQPTETGFRFLNDLQARFLP